METWKEKADGQHNHALNTIQNAISYIKTSNNTIFDIGMEAAYVYMLRPNPVTENIIESQTLDALNGLGDGDEANTLIGFEKAVGLPIRGSDKCHKESTCLSFETYMDLAKEHYHHYNDELQSLSSLATPEMHKSKLLLTTEDPNIFQNAMLYRNTTNFPYEIILNKNDNLQGSGKPTKFKRSAKDTILSSLVAIKMQLIPSVVYGNCCSNWHKVIRKLVDAGLSAVPNAQFNCLNLSPAAFDNPKYQICCAWGVEGEHTECSGMYREYHGIKWGRRRKQK